MTEKSRIEKVMLQQSMTAGQFASEIGVQNSTLSHILNDRNKPSLEVLKKILSRFPEISTDWLILGQGSMYRQEIHSKELTLFDSLDENSSLSMDLDSSDGQNKQQDVGTNQNEMLKKQFHAVSEASKTEDHKRMPSFVTNGASTVPGSIGSISEKEISEKINHGGTTSIPQRRATKVIIYFSVNTFQEFESK